MGGKNKLTLEDARTFAVDFLSKNKGANGEEVWNAFLDTVEPGDRKTYEKNNQFKTTVKGYVSRLSLENSGTKNDKGDASKRGNIPVVKIDDRMNELKTQPKTEETVKQIVDFGKAANSAIKNMTGKSAEEQEKIASAILPKAEKEKEQTTGATIAQASTPKKKTEQEQRKKEIEEKSNAFLKSWASTHPGWGKILSSKDLSFGQKVSLIGSALANIGANVTLGAKSGFEHSSFNGVPWDFKQAIDQYTDQEIKKVLGEGEQNAKAKAAAASFWDNYQKENGKKKSDELIALVDLYGDNPDILSSRLKAIGINKSADEVKELYSDLEKTNLSESAKQKRLDTQAKLLANRIQELQGKVTKETAEKLIAAQNALNNYNKIKYTSDGKTYNIEKAGNYLRNIMREVEGVASTVGGVVTGGVVGGIPAIKDGIIKAHGIPQKIVRADGTEVELDPNDNVYATKNELTSAEDDGSDIVPMAQDDEVITVQKRLGYTGGEIRKDFEYYLNKLRGGICCRSM